MDNGAKIYNLDCRREDIQRNCNQTVKLQCMDSRLTQFCTFRRRFGLQCGETGLVFARTMHGTNDGEPGKTPTILRKNEMQFQTANKICEGAINAEQETEDRSAVKPKMLKVPGEPSESERRLHELTHLPYRDWCEHCVKLKGRQSHAVKKKNDR